MVPETHRSTTYSGCPRKFYWIHSPRQLQTVCLIIQPQDANRSCPYNVVLHLLFTVDHFCFILKLQPMGKVQEAYNVNLLYTQAGLSFASSTCCHHRAFICFAEISEQTASTFPHSITGLVFIIQTDSVYWAVRIQHLNILAVFLFFFLSPTSFYLTMVRWRGVIAFDHIQGHTIVGRTPLDEGSARGRELYLTTLTTDIHAPGGIRTRNSSKRSAADPRLRPLGHWDRHI